MAKDTFWSINYRI